MPVRTLLFVLLGAIVCGGVAAAAPTEAERAARWADLRHAIFGDRVVREADGLVAIDAPSRAEDAAIVPVAITVADRLAPQIRGLYLAIDDNPSPLAAHFILGPRGDPRRIETRVRIDDYTYLHAVGETVDGRLYAAARFIKAAGGCSAPAGGDPAMARLRLGRMKLVLGEAKRPDASLRAKLLISHPNSSGLQTEQLTHLYIPADFLQTLKVAYNRELVFRVDSDIAISEDPTFNFAFRPDRSGVLTADMLDSNQRHFSRNWPVPAPPQM
jgi:sulfur-oxidizing protein SoxY